MAYKAVCLLLQVSTVELRPRLGSYTHGYAYDLYGIQSTLLLFPRFLNPVEMHVGITPFIVTSGSVSKIWSLRSIVSTVTNEGTPDSVLTCI